MEEFNRGKRIRKNSEEGSREKKMKFELNEENSSESDNENSSVSDKEIYNERYLGINEKIDDTTDREKEESHFLQLFTIILNTIINIKNIKESDISESITRIKESFKDVTYHTIDFTEWENICGFLYRYASHGAGFARFRILNAIQKCKMLKNALKKPDLKIIFLGSGPGNDAVGFCSALSELTYPKNLKLVLVDKFKEWSICMKLMDIFIKEGNFGRVSELFKKTSIDLSFIQTDLPGNMRNDNEYFGILEEADVIIISKVFSSFDRSNCGQHERYVIESLYKHMKEDAVVILNDTYFSDRWMKFNCEYSWGNGMEHVYKSTALADPRFNTYDDVSSKIPVNVLIKNSFHNRA